MTLKRRKRTLSSLTNTSSLNEEQLIQPIPILDLEQLWGSFSSSTVPSSFSSFNSTEIAYPCLSSSTQFYDIGYIHLNHPTIERAIHLIDEIQPKKYFALPFVQTWLDYNYRTTFLPFFHKYSVKELGDFFIFKAHQAWLEANPNLTYPENPEQTKLSFLSHFNKLFTGLSSIFNDFNIPRYFRSFLALKCIQLCKFFLNQGHLSTTLSILLSLKCMDDSLILPFCNIPTEKGASAFLLFNLLHSSHLSFSTLPASYTSLMTFSALTTPLNVKPLKHTTSKKRKPLDDLIPSYMDALVFERMNMDWDRYT